MAPLPVWSHASSADFTHAGGEAELLLGGDELGRLAPRQRAAIDRRSREGSFMAAPKVVGHRSTPVATSQFPPGRDTWCARRYS